MANAIVTIIKSNKLKLLFAFTTFIVGAFAAGGLTAALIFASPVLIPIFAGKIALDIAVIAAAMVIGGLVFGILPLLPALYNAIANKAKAFGFSLLKFFFNTEAKGLEDTIMGKIFIVTLLVVGVIVGVIAAIFLTVPLTIALLLIALTCCLPSVLRLQKADVWDFSLKTTFIAVLLGTLAASLLFAAAPALGATVVGALGLPVTIISLIAASLLVGGLVSLADQYTIAKVKPASGWFRAILFTIFNLLPRTLLIGSLLAGLTAGIAFGAAPALGALIVTTFTSLPAFISVLVISALAVGFASSLLLAASEWVTSKSLSAVKPPAPKNEFDAIDGKDSKRYSHLLDEEQSEPLLDEFGSNKSTGSSFFKPLGQCINLLTCCVDAQNDNIATTEKTL